jgi:hypothetical protein
VDPDTPVEPDAEPDVEPDSSPAEPASPARPESEWERRRRLAAVFGDGGPDQTSDDRDPREDRSGKGDDWYRDQVPPHHG